MSDLTEYQQKLEEAREILRQKPNDELIRSCWTIEGTRSPEELKKWAFETFGDDNPVISYGCDICKDTITYETVLKYNNCPFHKEDTHHCEKCWNQCYFARRPK